MRKGRGLVMDNKAYKKPNSDYIRLDLVIRKVTNKAIVNESKNTERQFVDPGKYKGKVWQRQVLTEEIETDYKTYLQARAKEENTSITRYIQNLIAEDMKKNGAVK